MDGAEGRPLPDRHVGSVLVDQGLELVDDGVASDLVGGHLLGESLRLHPDAHAAPLGLEPHRGAGDGLGLRCPLGGDGDRPPEGGVPHGLRLAADEGHVDRAGRGQDADGERDDHEDRQEDQLDAAPLGFGLRGAG